MSTTTVQSIGDASSPKSKAAALAVSVALLEHETRQQAAAAAVAVALAGQTEVQPRPLQSIPAISAWQIVMRAYQLRIKARGSTR
jgi:hypothetical protein